MVPVQVAVAAVAGGCHDEAGGAGAAAVGQADLQPGDLAVQGVEVDVGVAAQDDELARADVEQAVVGHKGFQQQAAVTQVQVRGPGQLQGVEAGGAAEEAVGGAGHGATSL